MRLSRLRHADWRGIFTDLALGALAVLGQAPFGLWPLSLLALALILRRLAQASSGWQAFKRGLFNGAGWFLIGLSWIVQPFLVDPLRYGWMAPFAVLLISFGLALFWALAAGTARRFGGGAIAIALALSLAELIRGHIFTGFPWVLPGHIWTSTWLIQMGSLVGQNGMTLLTLLALAAPLSLGWRRGAVVTAALAALSLGWSWHRLALPEPAPRDSLVRIVQPNIEQSLKWDPEAAGRNFATLLALTQGSAADLVIWPETAVPYLIREGEGVAQDIVAAGGQARVVTGIQRDQADQAWNSIAVFGPGGRILQSFDKMHLVPFGEYMPMGDLLYQHFGISAFASQLGAGFIAGTQRNLLTFGGQTGQALPLICYEAIFPGDLVSQSRADWMMQVTNDAWFGSLTGPYQHFDLTRLRAVEQGLPLVRAANTGISAFVDARGRVVADAAGQPLLLPLGQRGTLEARLPGALPPTPYSYMLARHGEAILAIMLLIGLVSSLKLRPRRNALDCYPPQV